MRLRLGLLVGLGLAVSLPATAGVWSRARRDGTIEFTNVPKAGGAWRRVEGLPRATAPAAPARGARSGRSTAAASTASTVWARRHPDGSMEFTNVQPVGANWKVLYKTGPGKASAVRGASDLVPPRDLTSARVHRFDAHIRDQQAFYGVPEALLRAVIKTESDYDPNVVSSAGAVGLMQLMPGTAKMMGVEDIWDPRQNIMGGARYLQVLAKRFCRTPVAGEVSGPSFVCSPEERVKVIAGYHAGPGAVERYGGLPPYETTRAYVTTVLARYERYRGQSWDEAAAPIARR